MIEAATAHGYILGMMLGVDVAGQPIVKIAHDDEEGLVSISAAAWAPEGNDWAPWIGKEFVCTRKAGSNDEVLLLGPLCVSNYRETEGPSETIHLKAQKELILECGEAKIHLRADGKIVVLGGYIVQRSRGVHKIRGASVQIN